MRFKFVQVPDKFWITELGASAIAETHGFGEAVGSEIDVVAVCKVVLFHDFQNVKRYRPAGRGTDAVQFDASVCDVFDGAADDFVVFEVVQREGAVVLLDKADQLLR